MEGPDDREESRGAHGALSAAQGEVSLAFLSSLRGGGDVAGNKADFTSGCASTDVADLGVFAVRKRRWGIAIRPGRAIGVAKAACFPSGESVGQAAHLGRDSPSGETKEVPDERLHRLEGIDEVGTGVLGGGAVPRRGGRAVGG